MNVNDDSQDSLKMRESVEAECAKCGVFVATTLGDLRKSIIVKCVDCKTKCDECVCE